MKRHILFVASIILIASLVLVGCGGAKSTAYRIATNAEFAPFEYVDENTKEVVGFDMDLIKAVAANQNLEIEIVNTGWDSLLAGMAQCQYDAAISAITILESRQKDMLFSDPYINAGQIVVVRTDNTTIKSKDDLAGKVVGAQLGTTGAEEIGKIPNTTLKTYDSYEFAFLDLSNGQIDAVVVDFPVAYGYVARNSDTIMTVGEPFTSEFYGIAVCKQNTELLAKINAGLKALEADGTIKALNDKWLAGNQ